MQLIKKQKVVLRTKVRKAHWKTFFWGGWKVLKVGLFLSLLVFSVYTVHAFLFQSDYFLVKSVSVEAAGKKAPLLIAKQLVSLKGKSIWNFSKLEVSGRLLNIFPEIDKVRIKRLLPDRLKVEVSLRHPVALVKVLTQGDIVKRVDFDGHPISSRFIEEESVDLPQLVIASNACLPTALSFLKVWQQKSKLKLEKIEVDSWGDVTIEGITKQPQAPRIKVVWGSFDAKEFSQKLDRLETIWTDLESRSLQAKVIHLKDALMRNNSNGEGGTVLGRAFVQLNKLPSHAQ